MASVPAHMHAQAGTPLSPPRITLFDGVLDIRRDEDLVSALSSSLALGSLLESSKIQALARELACCSEFTAQEWKFWVSAPATGTAGKSSLRYIGITGKGGEVLHITWKDIKASISFAQPTKAVTMKKKSGSRRYGIVGPRRTKRWTEYVPRGLTPAEVDAIRQRLEAAIHSSLQAHP